MKKLTDIEMQDLLDSGKTDLQSLQDEEINLYQKVFDVLNEEPEFGLPLDFASKVTENIEVRPKISRSERVWLAVCIIYGVLFLVALIIIMYLFMGINLGNYIPIIGFGLVIIAIVQWLDKRLMRQIVK